MFLVWSIVIIEEAWKYVCLFIEKTIQLILHVKLYYFISQNKDMSSGVICRWVCVCKTNHKTSKILVSHLKSAKTQISKK